MLSRYNINGRTIQEEKLLSEGGYGYILKAIDVNTKEIFALKKSYCQGEERTKVARNELEIMKRLPRHPNLVNFIGGTFIQDKGQQVCLILMEFCGGGSLFDLMAKDPNSRFPEEQLLGYMREITQGIKSLHTLQPPMAHRDIKIENVLFQNGRCKLCDFGSASTQRVDLSQIRQSDFVIYEEEWEKNTTLMYRPPEMADLFLRYEVGEKADVWMLGCVLYTLCFFIHPFQESSKLAISTATYNIPKQHRYSDKLIDLIRLMLTPDPKLRPSIFDVERILAQFHSLPYIQLNAQAVEIKNREQKLEQEMEQYNKNSFKVKKFDGDIPIDELMNLQKKIQTEKTSAKQPQQQIRQPQQQYIQRQQMQQQQQQQQRQQQQQQFQPFSEFNQQQQQSKSSQDIFAQFSNPQQGFGSNNAWDSSNQWSQQQPNQQAFGNFGFVSTSHSPSPNPFQWDTQFNQPQQQQQQQQQQQVQQQVQQMQINSFSASPSNSAWDMTTNYTEQSHQSTQPSTNFWGGNSQQQFGVQNAQIQSQQLPLNPQQETIDLIGLNEPQPQQQQYDLSNIIL
ncbi:unnamed protein product [Paramecium octaurelia]|uniref:non-specific serine/threonine protein kinase n=1 Tax=Paramecium octaurelia TaxID=43137 RepID=A0A8S1TJJ9_PAROT|nr:unnamed protein product [Paramecium octaurelia]